MSRRIVSITTITPTAFADTTNLTAATFPFLLQNASSTQLSLIWEISISGQAASSSSPTFMLLSRDSTIGTSGGSNGAGQTDTALDPAFQTLAAVPNTGNTWTTTVPQRSASAHLANASLNAFGGSYFWRANRMEECFQVYGNTQPNGEASLSAFTGGTPGAIGAHMIYETLLVFMSLAAGISALRILDFLSAVS